MMKDAREIKDKMINDAKEEAQAEKYDWTSESSNHLKKCSYGRK
jgi:hypothetical protein